MLKSHFNSSGPLSNKMESTISRLRYRLDSTIKYLTPLLPLANCHMVEFLTECHWDRLIPPALRVSLENCQLNDALEKFWKTVEDPKNSGDSEVSSWIKSAQSHTIAADNDYCLTVEQLQSRIKAWGGNVKPEIRITEFMTSKKSYEVSVMSRLVAAVSEACGASCCVEVGGGRGPLLAALSIAHALPSLTVDCDQQLLAAAEQRTAIIQKQWHAIAKRKNNGTEERMQKHEITKNLHRFAKSYVTSHTDLLAIAKESFPDLPNDGKLLLTGLHTCGNLGPDSLRIFINQPTIAAVFNVPCCYHLLTEDTDASLFDVFQKNYGGDTDMSHGFPLSDHLKGYSLGRNARMLAAQSIDRVVNLRQLPSKSLLYRALLQVIVKKHLPDRILSDGKLKRVAQKCANFTEYFKMADNILKLGLFDNLADSDLSDVCRDMERQWEQLVIFYLLRLCLAQVVESVILLDRLLFLFESGYDKVYLVKLFDPVLSPRCHSIVAVR